MIYITKMNKKLEEKMKHLNNEIKEEIRSNNIRILGHDFVKNNKNKAKLIINNKKIKLKELINSKEIQSDKIKINMIILNKELSNISHMFENCAKLIKLSYFNNIINIDFDEETLKFEVEYFDINYNKNSDEDSQHILYKNSRNNNKNLNYSEVQERTESYETNSSTIAFIKDKLLDYQYNYFSDISRMCYNCLLLSSLPDISKWNTDNVIDMNSIFYNCSSLTSLPDISKWNTNNVIDMNNFFYFCSALLSLPEISKWNTSNVVNMGRMFYGCLSLTSLPDISKWNTDNVTDMKNTFYFCSSLISLPDISKWNTNNVTDMGNIFFFALLYYHYLIYQNGKQIMLLI